MLNRSELIDYVIRNANYLETDSFGFAHYRRPDFIVARLERIEFEAAPVTFLKGTKILVNKWVLSRGEDIDKLQRIQDDLTATFGAQHFVDLIENWQSYVGKYNARKAQDSATIEGHVFAAEKKHEHLDKDYSYSKDLAAKLLNRGQGLADMVWVRRPSGPGFVSKRAYYFDGTIADLDRIITDVRGLDMGTCTAWSLQRVYLPNDDGRPVYIRYDVIGQNGVKLAQINGTVPGLKIEETEPEKASEWATMFQTRTGGDGFSTLPFNGTIGGLKALIPVKYLPFQRRVKVVDDQWVYVGNKYVGRVNGPVKGAN